MKSALQAGRAFLRAARNEDGSWGYTVGQEGHAEPTVLAAAAGADDAWLSRDWLNGNPLHWASFLLPAVAWQRDPALCELQLRRIAAFASQPVEGVEGFDATLPGWSWVPGTAAWVMPTAFAMLSLRRSARQPERVAEGVALILDRQCSDGGWNYGNPMVYGAQLAGHLDSTGWALLALPPGSQPQRAIDAGLDYLSGALTRPSTMGLALGALAWQAHGRDSSTFVERLAPRVGADGARARCDLTALACAALAAHLEDWHAFV